MGIFVIIEFLLIVGVFIFTIQKLTKNVYEIQLVSVSGAIILLCNIMMFVVYFNYAGMPFLTDQHESNLKHHVYVALFWTFAFIIKYSTAFGVLSPDNVQNGTDDEQQNLSHKQIVFYAIVYFTLSIVCDVLPFIACLDLKFIHIQTFDLIQIYQRKQQNQKEIENQILLTNKENQIRAVSNLKANGEILEEFKMVSPRIQFKL